MMHYLKNEQSPTRKELTSKSYSLSKALTCLLLLVTTTAIAASFEDYEGPLWFWFADGNGTWVKLEVRLDEKVVYQSTFPMCHAKRTSHLSKIQSTKLLKYSFKPRRAIVWSGYKDYAETTKPNQEIQGCFWQAGADPGWFILGVDFFSPDKRYMHTMHIGYPDRPIKWEVVEGLVLITAPVEASLWKPPTKTQ